MHITVIKNRAAYYRRIQTSTLGETAGSLEMILNPDSDLGAVMISFQTSKGIAKYSTTLVALTSAIEELKRTDPTPAPTDENGFIVTVDPDAEKFSDDVLMANWYDDIEADGIDKG